MKKTSISRRVRTANANVYTTNSQIYMSDEQNACFCLFSVRQTPRATTNRNNTTQKLH